MIKRWRRVGVVLAALLALAAGSLVAAGAALADDAGEYPSCQFFYSTGVGPSYGGGFYSPDTGDWYAYSPTWTVTSWSACEDVTIADQFGDVWHWRVRFFPSSGGSYANGWKGGGCQYCSVLVATNVSNGTRLRIEGHKLSPDGTQTTYSRPISVYL